MGGMSEWIGERERERKTISYTVDVEFSFFVCVSVDVFAIWIMNINIYNKVSTIVLSLSLSYSLLDWTRYFSCWFYFIPLFFSLVLSRLVSFVLFFFFFFGSYICTLILVVYLFAFCDLNIYMYREWQIKCVFCAIVKCVYMFCYCCFLLLWPFFSAAFFPLVCLFVGRDGMNAIAYSFFSVFSPHFSRRNQKLQQTELVCFCFLFSFVRMDEIMIWNLVRRSII